MMNTQTPNHLHTFRKALEAAYDRYKPSTHCSLRRALRELFRTPGGRATVDHFMHDRRGIPASKWPLFQACDPAWRAMPLELKTTLNRLWTLTYKPRFIPQRPSTPTETYATLLVRWEGMVDQLAAELITPDDMKAELRRVLGRQGDRRRRL